MEIIGSPVLPEKAQALRAKAKELEAAFLAEMLKHMEPSHSSESFGGGIGEEQFGSFLRQSQAAAIVEKGGIGLAEMIFASLVKEEGTANG